MHQDLSIKIKTQTLRGVIENPEAKKLMILVHGFTGDWQGPDNIFEKLSLSLQKVGYAVLRFSFRGTPPSDGEFIDMMLSQEVEDLNEIINYARNLGYQQIGLLGESMGGSVVLEVLDQKPDVLVLWYTAFDFLDCSFKLYLTEEATKKLQQDGYLLEDGYKVGKKFIEELPHINLYSKVEAVKCPVLFLHGQQDTDVPHEQTLKAFDLAREPKEMTIVPKANHCFKKEKEEVIKLTVDFLKKYF